jgi:hypothetical protein
MIPEILQKGGEGVSDSVVQTGRIPDKFPSRYLRIDVYGSPARRRKRFRYFYTPALSGCLCEGSDFAIAQDEKEDESQSLSIFRRNLR